MNLRLLDNDVQDFIHSNLQSNSHSIALKGVPFHDVSAAEIANHIVGMKQMQRKAPDLYHPNLLYHRRVNLEQMSSQETAKYKASLLPNVYSILDCTGGFGIDSIFLSEKASKSFYCELDENLVQIATHNFTVLGKSIETYHANGIEVLKEIQSVDVLFVDPSRRTESKQKIISLDQSTPNILEHWDLFLRNAKLVMVKLSPLLDINYLLNNLRGVYQIHVISVHNDVKEIVVLAKKQFNQQAEIIVADYANDDWHSTTVKPTTAEAELLSYLPKAGFLYEPKSVVLKANAQNELANQLRLKKISTNSHLYFSNEKVESTWFKCFAIQQMVAFKPKKIKKLISGKYVNVISRNFPLNPEQILKKLGKQHGGNQFLICTSTEQEKFCFIATKQSN